MELILLFYHFKLFEVLNLSNSLVLKQLLKATSVAVPFLIDLSNESVF